MAHRVASPLVLGLKTAGGALSSATLAINASTTRLMLGCLGEGKTLSKVRFYVSAVTGTLGASDIVAELYQLPDGLLSTTTASGSGTLVESRSTVTSTPTGAAWVEVTGWTSVCTAGKQYAIVLKNANGTPASNNYTVRWVTGLHDDGLGSGSMGWWKRQSTDSGSTYSSNTAAVAGLELEWSDGSLSGLAASQGSVTAVGDGIYQARELGANFTTPAQARPRVIGVLALLAVSGTPTGNIRFRIYRGTTLVATTEPQTQRTGASTVQMGFFTSVQELDAAVEHYVTCGETTNADTSANRINLQELTVRDAAATKGLLPSGGWRKALLDSTWTVTDTASIAIALILDGEQPYASVTPPPRLRVATPGPLRRRGSTSLATGALARTAVTVVAATPPPAIRVAGPAAPRSAGAAFARGGIARTDTAIVLATPAPGVSVRGAPAPGRRRGAAVQHGAVARVDTTIVAATPPPRIQVSGPRPVSRR